MSENGIFRVVLPILYTPYHDCIFKYEKFSSQTENTHYNEQYIFIATIFAGKHAIIF